MPASRVVPARSMWYTVRPVHRSSPTILRESMPTMHRLEQSTSPSGAAGAHLRRSALGPLSHFLARLPASGYALLFLASIPLFAALYHYVFPDDFYSDTVTHESHYHREVVRLQRDLQD